MDELRNDVRFAVRGVMRNRGFTIIALCTIALGIGVNTAIFSVVNGVLLRPLPYPDADRLYTVWENLEQRDGPAQEWTGRSTFVDWRDRSQTFAYMSAVTGWAPELTGTDRPEVLQGALVSPDYFRVLGVEPVRGRSFSIEEENPGTGRVAVLGHDLWQRRFGGDPAIIGSSLTLSGDPFVVVGVAPPGFQPPIVNTAEIWSVLRIDPARDDRGSYFLRVIGRLDSGVSVEASRTDMTRVAASIAEENPIDYRDVGVALVPLEETMVGAARTPLLILLGAVGLVLLISCANVANLLLARASVRERELAVRASLGAGRWRIVRQLVTESVVLALVGGALGLGLGVWGTELLVRLAPPGLPRVAEIGLHPAVFGFALLASLLTGLLFGLAPALGYSAGSSGQALREGARGSSSARGGRLRGALVVAELALGVAVLVSAGLLLRSFQEMRSVDPGFRVENAMSARLLFPAARYEDGSSITSFIDQLETRLASRPGVEAVGAASVLPLSGLVNDISWGIEGRMPEPGEELLADSWRATPGFFPAMGIPLIEGRLFNDGDREGATPVALVSRSLAERHFPTASPIGQRLRVGNVRDPEAPWWTIVGVVETVRTRAIDRVPEPEIFVPAAQRPTRGLSLVVRTSGDPAPMAAAIREAVWELDGDMAIGQLSTLEDVFAASVASERFTSLLLATFAGLALILGAIGIYGVMAFLVARRTREIGIRMALGARPAVVLRSVLARGMGLTAVGLAIGLAVAMLAGRALSSLLFQVQPADPVTLVSVSLLLGLSAFIACVGPASRATRVDPINTLREQ